MKDDLGGRIKEQYESRTKYFLPRRSYTIIRLDGKAFHSFTKGFERPFDETLMECIDYTARCLCEDIQGAVAAYSQSDEISILLCDFKTIKTEAWFNNNIQKMVSISASLATAKFNEIISAKTLALFDSRVFTIPDPVEVENYFIWRQQDALRNSIQLMAQSLYSQKELQGKNTNQLQDLIHEKGFNWNDLSVRKKRGRIILKERYQPDGEEFRNIWLLKDPPVFTQNREYLRSIIPSRED